MSVRDRLIQLTLRARNFLSGDVQPATDSMRELAEEGRRLKASMDEVGRARGMARTLRDNQQATEGLARAQADARATLDDLTRELGDNAEATAGQRIAMREARRTLDEAERAYKKNQSAIKNLTTELKQMGVDTDNVTAEEKRLAGELEDGKKALGDNREAIKQKRIEEKKAADTTKEHADRVDATKGVLADAGRKVLAFAAAYVSLNAVMGLVQRGLSLVAQGIRAVAMDGSDKQQALGQLEAALASTGRQAEFTSQQLLDMADAIEASSLLAAEQVQSAQARLLSYTDVAATEFPRAMQIIIDQQQRLGISVEQSAEIVGRALQSPSEAIATLGRQGFKLEDGQKRLLKQLEATGKTAEAQAIIMDMLTEAYGGSAAAARMNTAAGLWKGLGDRIGDFASRVANFGAFDFMQRKLLELSDYLDEMANDGRLDRLAEGISKGFIQGAEWAERFAKKLLDIDFQKAGDDAAAWFSNLGQHLDETQQKLAAFALPFRALFNGLTSGLSLVAAAVTGKMSEVLGLVETVAERLPKALGGERLHNSVRAARESLDGLTAGFVAQVEQDGKDLQSALDAAMGGVADSTKARLAEVTEAVKLETVSQADYVRQAVTSMQGALDQISAAKTVSTLRQIGEEMYAAYGRGDISQQEYAASSVELSKRLRDLGGAVTSVSTAAGIAAESLKSLADVQRAISDAKTDRDITAIRTALKRLYDDGLLGATDYNTALAKLTARQKELKGAVEQGTKAQADKNAVDKEAIVTSEQLRRESGKRMEAERKAGDQAMQDRRQGSEEAKRDMGAMGEFFGGVMSRAREPVAALSAAALEAFDKLRGISSVDMSIDTSSVDATRESLGRVAKALDDVKAAQSGVGVSTLGRWMLDTRRASLETQQAFLGQKASLQELMDGYARGDMSVRQFIASARGAKSAMGLLDASDLSSLESAIASAQQRMQQMGESTRSTLESLQDELDGLQGRQDDIERRRFAARQRELQAQLAEAQSGGDSQAVANASRALGMLRQIEAESAQQRQRQAQEKRIEEVKASQAAPAPSAAPAKILRLESPSGKAVDVGISSDQDETKLLDILGDAGLRAL